jgi:histone-lysine N-methyltransferase SETMAR
MVKAGLHPNMAMLCVWLDLKGILHYELLSPNETITAKRSCAQLEDLKLTTAEKRPAVANRTGIIFYQNNNHPHCNNYTGNIKGAKMENSQPPALFF